MGFFVNDLKVKATAGSMHQFCQVVRSIFPGHADDRVIEAATVYLYAQVAEDLFGKRFTSRLKKQLGARIKYSTPSELAVRVAKIKRQARVRARAVAALSPVRSPEERVRLHVTSVIESLLFEAGFEASDPEVVRQCYARFEDVVRQLKKHLQGIKEQNYFLMSKMAGK